MEGLETDLISFCPNVLRRSADLTVAADLFDKEGYWQYSKALPLISEVYGCLWRLLGERGL